VLLLFRGPTTRVPEVAWVPLQTPDAVQLAALLVVQVMVDVPAMGTLIGFAEIFIAGSGLPPLFGSLRK
jgi:hypothetical protein